MSKKYKNILHITLVTTNLSKNHSGHIDFLECIFNHDGKTEIKRGVLPVAGQ